MEAKPCPWKLEVKEIVLKRRMRVEANACWENVSEAIASGKKTISLEV